MFLPAHWARLCLALLCRSPLTLAYAFLARQPSAALKTRDAF
jgi:filamentous hemagglutinin